MDEPIFRRSVTVPSDVMVQELPDGDSVVLDLRAERYFGLDAVATRMWAVMTRSPTIEQAVVTLLEEYEADEQQVRNDLRGMVETFVERGLVRVDDPQG